MDRIENDKLIKITKRKQLTKNANLNAKASYKTELVGVKWLKYKNFWALG